MKARYIVFGALVVTVAALIIPTRRNAGTDLEMAFLDHLPGQRFTGVKEMQDAKGAWHEYDQTMVISGSTPREITGRFEAIAAEIPGWTVDVVDEKNQYFYATKVVRGDTVEIVQTRDSGSGGTYVSYYNPSKPIPTWLLKWKAFKARIGI